MAGIAATLRAAAPVVRRKRREIIKATFNI
jgi:hypothetical protein